MNLVKKIDRNKIVIFLEERDLNDNPDTILESLKEIIPIAPGNEIELKLPEITDIPVIHFAILLAFFKSMRSLGAKMTIKCDGDLLYSLLEVGIGNLVTAIEEI